MDSSWSFSRVLSKKKKLSDFFLEFLQGLVQKCVFIGILPVVPSEMVAGVHTRIPPKLPHDVTPEILSTVPSEIPSGISTAENSFWNPSRDFLAALPECNTETLLRVLPGGTYS